MKNTYLWSTLTNKCPRCRQGDLFVSKNPYRLSEITKMNEHCPICNQATEIEVGFWLHGEHLLFEGRKMSKSARNVVLLKDVIDRGFDPLAVRLCFLENRYRSQMDLTWASIEAADATLKRWRKKVQAWGTQVAVKDQVFLEILDNDLDTPKAIQYLRNLEKNDDLSNRAALFLFADQILGLDLNREELIKPLTSEQEEILKLRQIARSEKQWAKSDELRIELEGSGLEIMDGPEGQTWNWR